MATVGTLTVNVSAGTADFKRDMADAQGSVKEFGQVHSSTMREGIGGVRLLSHELGVPLPREISRLIAQIPGIGMAFSALVPVLGAVFAVTMVEHYIAKQKEASDALNAGFGKALEETTSKSDTLRVSIAESQLKIDTLLGKPTSGDALAIEIAKAKVEADKLYAGLVKDLDEFIKLEEAASHGSIMAALLGTPGEGAQARDVAKGLRDELAKIPKDAQDYGQQVQKALADSWARAEFEITKTHAEEEQKRAELSKHLLIIPADFSDQYDKRIKALQAYQVQLSAANDLEDLGRQKDQNDSKIKNIEAAQTAVKLNQKVADEEEKAAEANKKYTEEMAGAREKYYKEEYHHVQEIEEQNEKYYAAVREEAKKTFDASERMNARLAEEEKSHADRMADLDEGHSKGKGAEDKNYAKKVEDWKKERKLLEQQPLELAKIDNKMEEEAQKHQNRLDAIAREHEQKRADLVKEFAQQTLFEHKSAAQALEQIGKQMTQTMIDQLIQGLLVQKDVNAQEKLSDASTAAGKAWNAMAGIPIIGPALGAAAAAATFAGIMAFAHGGTVPGYGDADTVPAMLMPGETVVTKALTEQVAQSQGGSKSTTNNNTPIHMHVHAVDAAGFGELLTKHGSLIQQHVTKAVRRANR